MLERIKIPLRSPIIIRNIVVFTFRFEETEDEGMAYLMNHGEIAPPRK